jgi:hypothetical protein
MNILRLENDNSQEEYVTEEILEGRNCERRSPSPTSLGDELAERINISSELALPVQKIIKTRRYISDYSTDTKPHVTVDVVKSPHEPGVDEVISKMKQNSELEDLAAQSWAGGVICPNEGCGSWNPYFWPKEDINICCACRRKVDQWVDATSLRQKEKELIVAEGLSRGAEEAIGGVGFFGSGFTIGLVSALFVLKVAIHASMGR